MSATIMFTGVEARITDYVWYCDVAEVKMTLDTFLDQNGPSGGDPQPDITVAKAVKAAFPEMTKIVKTEERRRLIEDGVAI